MYEIVEFDVAGYNRVGPYPTIDDATADARRRMAGRDWINRIGLYRLDSPALMGVLVRSNTEGYGSTGCFRDCPDAPVAPAAPDAPTPDAPDEKKADKKADKKAEKK